MQQKPSQEELFAAVDELLAGEPELPAPDERGRLREAAGVSQARLAQVLRTTKQTVKNWESGRSEPRPPQRQAYLRLLEGWAAKYPAESATEPEQQRLPSQPVGQAPPPEPIAQAPTAEPIVQAPSIEPIVQAPSAEPVRQALSFEPVRESQPVRQPAPAARRPSRTRAPAPAADAPFPHGPLGVLDGDGTVFCLGGVLLECTADTIPGLAEWVLRESGIGAARLHRHGKDADPLIALTASAAERFGLPQRLEDRRGLRLPDDHPVVRQITGAKWKLTQRGFGPWPRIYRPAQGGLRQCVQLAILPWDALDNRAWGDAARLHPADLARVLGVFATRVLTPRGSTAVTGLELMTATRPPTRPVKDEATGAWVSGPNPGALTRPADPAPPEAPLEHPVAQGWDRGFLDEEAHQWVRDPALLSDEECLRPWAVGIDVNTAFLAAASRLTVGLSEPEHHTAPAFDKKAPGTWLVDLSAIELDPRLPNPFTSTGLRPEGPGWYSTPTLAYAEELGHEIRPVEAYLRRETGAYLDPWHDRLKDAYLTTSADMGIPVHKDADPAAYLDAMALHRTYAAADETRLDALRAALAELPGAPADVSDGELSTLVRRHRQGAMVLAAIKSTVKGGIGKLRERPQGRHYRDGERWPALERPTWNPYIRAAVIAKARVNLHRKAARLAALTGLHPLAVLSDCVVYASRGPSPLHFLPSNGDGTPVYGTFRIGANPGFCKLEGVQETAWAVDLMEQGHNPARHIKGDGHDARFDEGE
ncbi:telomere-associated protein Tap [Streptomyces caniscabiei]|uniref:Helix-turn-helix domain-containing protein n=1 Tax=Streptomyces caniscabiei TaxID=2746961 RepID=A0ABU4MP44_9ACTN|nr:helix-turn-helix domain-containing protein [Streptomyces caniscabiei]MDX2940703.1 helix-turn-helix domain-containing protein [Streptomyces caniscabiei]MDX2952827.1 helix-turn-helix domain-containing protein [Streptomyces caniscabiei]MDX2982662.1 helix-turn-helix domain-containing protein [Streptomyces caniscabiei]MDX3008700.1 helix-turn-helix domain-containing protein [Streptomyces caniscabiei]MDX3038367.1 helix-turn-helix domain-containing protein [Streptomyces caniscabiei]